eukprot:c43707_g1_i1 orf=360-788(-)
MGSRQFGFDLSSWSLRPGLSLALGGVLVVVMIMATTAICFFCYYWAMLLKKAMRAHLLSPPLPPPLPLATHDQQPPSEFMKLEPPHLCLPSTVVLMPGEDMPTFLALPCHPCSIEVKMQDNNETKEGNGNMRDVEVKVEIYI